ncbi:hypothetical protein DFJ58DRAFT_787896 [Suillus subalutaceus]|uniref:uncharacterized protein n=1 Tax=Suillus subalutaceus TaxID=48586 RepID=UPI001B8860DA|nr:uncharacterized protein DFJ58DRAFT_787896 [Suillus subalutaceus]KAG1854435.1 hypothetical protein DFJ58DRAFT_787896 [Suillus subalutaceus]
MKSHEPVQALRTRNSCSTLWVLWVSLWPVEGHDSAADDLDNSSDVNALLSCAAQRRLMSLPSNHTRQNHLH